PNILRVTFSPDGGRILATGGFSSVAVWDAATGQALPALQGHSLAITALAFSPDGKLMATGGFDRTIRLWDVGAWRPMKLFIGHGHQVINLAFSPDSKTLASASMDRTIKLWDVAAEPNPLVRVDAKFMAFAPDGRKLASSSGKEVKLWDTATWRLTAAFKAEPAAATSVS